MRHLLAATIMFTLGASLGSAGDAWAGFDEGVAAYEKRDYKTALSELLPLAEKGHTAAQSLLGIMYKDGAGVPRDKEEAARWLHKAADQGDMDAQLYLGMKYPMTSKAPLDPNGRFKWMSRAATQGHPVARYYLGAAYAAGTGVPQNAVMALMWLNLSVLHGNEELAEDRDKMAKGMDQDQTIEAQRLTTEWIAAHEGSQQHAAEWIAKNDKRRKSRRSRRRVGNLFFSKDLYASLKKEEDEPAQFDPMALTSKEIRDIKSRLRQCWKLPSNSSLAKNSTVKLRVLLNSDGSLSKTPQIILDNWYVTKPGKKSYTFVTNHAVRAVLDCDPFILPSEKYEHWREMVLTFRQGYNEDRKISVQ